MAAEAPLPTPGGPAVAVVLCLLPLALLIMVTLVKQLLLPTRVSLPAAAALMALVRLAYLSAPPGLVLSCVVGGLLEALTPLSIIGGAILLFRSMEHTGCLKWMMGAIKDLSAGHPVAEVFLIGFAFSKLIEGASGFGTPTALVTPMLAALGHDPVLSVVALLLFVGFSAMFGAVGTPIWFGFGGLHLTEHQLRVTGFQTAVIAGLSSLVVVPLAASVLVPWRDLVRSGVFVALSILSAVVPSVAIALFSYEFPSLIGGLIATAITALLVRYRVGLRPPLSSLTGGDVEAACAPAGGHASVCVGVGPSPGKPSPFASAAAASACGGASPRAASRAASMTLGSHRSSHSFTQRRVLGALLGAGSVEVDGRNMLVPTPTGRMLRGMSGDVSMVLEEGRDAAADEEAVGLPYIPPDLGTIPAYPMPNDLGNLLHQRDAATQVDEGVLDRVAGTVEGATPDSGFPCLGAHMGGHAYTTGGLRQRSAHYIRDGPRLIPLGRAGSGALTPAASSRVPSRVGGASPLSAAGGSKDADLWPAPGGCASGGVSSHAVAAAAAAAGLALPPLPEQQQLGGKQPFWPWLREAALRTLPLTGTVLLLVVTRVPQLRLKGLLQSRTPRFLLPLGTLGDFGISASLVVQLLDIGKAGGDNPTDWHYELLYIPFLLPFVAMSCLTLLVHRRQLKVRWTAPFKEAAARVAGITQATLGALVLVELMSQGGVESPSHIIGYYTCTALGKGFLAIGGVLGAVGTFFSGSSTIANLVFSDIQRVAAQQLGLSVTAVLAVQAAGAAMGNAFAIGNILAGKAVMGLQSVPESVFLARTLPLGLLAVLLESAFGLMFTIGGLGG